MVPMDCLSGSLKAWTLTSPMHWPCAEQENVPSSWSKMQTTNLSRMRSWWWAREHLLKWTSSTSKTHPEQAGLSEFCSWCCWTSPSIYGFQQNVLAFGENLLIHSLSEARSEDWYHSGVVLIFLSQSDSANEHKSASKKHLEASAAVQCGMVRSRHWFVHFSNAENNTKRFDLVILSA